MPERNPTRFPTIVAGTSLESGTPNTGQVLSTFGGTKTQSYFSGLSLTDRQVHVGAGRLDFAQHVPLSATLRAASGQPIIFYDSAVQMGLPPLSGMTIADSGAKVIGVLLPSTNNSGVTVWGEKREFGAVFTSGLCVQALSGAPAWTVSYTPVVSGSTNPS